MLTGNQGAGGPRGGGPPAKPNGAVDTAASTAAGGPAPDSLPDIGRYDGIVVALERVAQDLAALPVEQLPDTEVDGLITRLRRPLQQLEGVRARAAAVSQARVVSRSNGAATAGAVRDHQRRLAEEQQLTPSEVQRQIAAGRSARDNAGTRRAMEDGDIGPRHAERIAEVLSATPLEYRAEVEEELLELAGRLDALAFGRAARRLLGRIRPEALARDERRKHLDRAFRGTDTEDGGFAFSGLLYGVAAEQARVALNAFRRPDARDELRTPAQRGADAFEQLCAAALRLGDAPTQHGQRPQVGVLFTAEQYAALSRSPELAAGSFAGSSQTASGRELRQLTDDCELFRVVLDARGIPIEVSSEVRTVPTGLWRALLVRDGGCVWEGCDAPASWCDVAHGKRSYARKGRLSLDNALLLCRRHHRRFDQGPHTVEIDGDQVTIRRITPGQEEGAGAEEDGRDGVPATGGPPTSDAPGGGQQPRPDLPPAPPPGGGSSPGGASRSSGSPPQVEGSGGPVDPRPPPADQPTLPEL